MIVSAKWQNNANTEASIVSDSGEERFGITPAGRFWQELQDWIALGNTPDPVDPPPAPPTNDQIYDQVIKTQKVLKAYILAVNDGSIMPGSDMTGAQIKARVKAKM